jgi:hypothetical protein
MPRPTGEPAPKIKRTPTFLINGVMYPGMMDDAAMAAAFKTKS